MATGQAPRDDRGGGGWQTATGATIAGLTDGRGSSWEFPALEGDSSCPSSRAYCPWGASLLPLGGDGSCYSPWELIVFGATMAVQALEELIALGGD